MGLMMRDDPPKVIDLASRTFGPTVGDFALSVQETEKEDPDQLVTLSVVLHNRSANTLEITVPGWVFFYHVTAVGSDGQRVPLSPFGAQLLKPERRTEAIPLKLAPGEANENELPVGSLMTFRRNAVYTVGVSCEMPGGITLHSNEITLRG